jgi:hypothetical protein
VWLITPELLKETLKKKKLQANNYIISRKLKAERPKQNGLLALSFLL